MNNLDSAVDGVAPAGAILPATVYKARGEAAPRGEHKLIDITRAADELHIDVPPFLGRAADRADELVQRGADAVHHGTQRLRERADLLSARTADSVRQAPVKALLMAAAVGAALMALLALVGQSRRPS